jgi:hypothetical protein
MVPKSSELKIENGFLIWIKLKKQVHGKSLFRFLHGTVALKNITDLAFRLLQAF